jgi:hypothetical protein
MKLKIFLIWGFLGWPLQQINAAETKKEECNNQHCYAQQAEETALPKASAFFKRSGPKLELKLSNGFTKKWEDRSTDSVEEVFYRLTAFYPAQKIAALTRLFWEGSDEVLVSLESGKEFKLEANHQMSLEPDLYVAELGETENYSGAGQNVAKIYYCDPASKKFCSLIKTFPKYAGKKIIWKKEGEFELEFSKDASKKTRKVDAIMGSYDIFQVTGKCTPKSCTSSNPKYLKTESQ